MKLTDKDLETIVKRRKCEVPTVLISLQLKKLVSGEFSRFGDAIVRLREIHKLIGSGGGGGHMLKLL